MCLEVCECVCALYRRAWRLLNSFPKDRRRGRPTEQLNQKKTMKNNLRLDRLSHLENWSDIKINYVKKEANVINPLRPRSPFFILWRNLETWNKNHLKAETCRFYRKWFTLKNFCWLCVGNSKGLCHLFLKSWFWGYSTKK